MKKFIFILFIFIISNNAWSQHRHKSNNKSTNETPTWFFLDLQGGYGVDEYFNNNINNDQNVEISYVNPSFSYAGKFGVNFSFGVGLAFEMGIANYSQSYDINNGIETFTHTSSVSALEKTILLRHSSLGSYIEAGPQFLGIKSGSSNGYNNFTNIVIGFGGPLVYKNSFDINLGLRLTYSLSDVMNNYYPDNAGLKYIPLYSPYSPTSIFSAQLTLGFNWHIGYFSQAKCDKHIEFLFM